VNNDERDVRIWPACRVWSIGRGVDRPSGDPGVAGEVVRQHSNLRTGFNAQAHAVMAKNGVLPSRHDVWGPSGNAPFDVLRLRDTYESRLCVGHSIVIYVPKIGVFERDVHVALRYDRGCPGRAGHLPGRAGVRS
jgi:hypothetical protein